MMTLSSSVSEDEDASSVPVDADVYRQMIQQLYESSMQRDGIDSEQTRMLKVHLTAHSSQD
jgi:hypothetical protein